MGRTPLENAKVYEWMCWLSGTVHSQGYGHLFRAERYTSEGSEAGRDMVRRRARETLGKAFEVIEGRLGEKGWAVGEGLTAVDAYLFVFFRWGNIYGFELKEKYPKYTALMRKLLERGSVKRALASEGIESTL